MKHLLSCLFVILLLSSVCVAETLILPEGLITIEEEAFCGNTALDQVVLGNQIVRIDARAFKDSSLTSINLPASLTQIDDTAFEGVENLTVTAEQGTYAYEWAVDHGYISRTVTDASVFKTSNLNDGTLYIESYTGSDTDVIIPREIDGKAVTRIGYNAFQGNTSLTSVFIPEGVTDMGSFQGCTSLKSVVIPGSVDTIPYCAFYQCASLKTVYIQEGSTIIGGWAFGACSALEDITIPQSMTSIGEYAFYGCSSLKEILLPNDITAIDSNAFPYYSGILYADMDSQTAHHLGKAGYAFRVHGNNYSLKYLFTDDAVTGLSLCSVDKDVTSFSIPENVTEIGNYSFQGCGALTEVTIPGSVTSIGSYAFCDVSCTMLFKGDAPEFADNVFSSESAIMAYYPHDNATWTEEVRQNYGAGSILWFPDNVSFDVDDLPRDASEPLIAAVTDNAGGQNYQTWASTVKSHLAKESDGTLTRVECADDRVYIEQYSDGLSLIWKKTLTFELPVWGGFHSGEKYNFLVFGQKNSDQDDGREIMRVVRYTKNWHRVDSASVYGANTTDPFAFGSLRMVEAGDYLYVHTCHQMYTSSDGLRHQANMNYEIYVPSMTIIRQNYKVSNSNYDYVSHSFNQFVITDGSDIVKVDHGDAYPRSLTMLKIAGSARTSSYGKRTRVDLISFNGEIGQNYTGASVGGLEASGSRYIVAGNSIDQSRFGSSTQRNIFVAAADKGNLTEAGVSLRWITSYADSDSVSVSTPVLVKISADKFLLMWTESSSKIHYTFLNGKGEPTGAVYVGQARLSDCKPILWKGSVTWYVTDGSAPVFYTIDPDRPSIINRF